jgi:hypothetical protein
VRCRISPATAARLSAPDRIPVAQPVLDQELVERAHRDNPLLDGGVRQARAAVHVHQNGAARVRAAEHVADPRRDDIQARDERVGAGLGQEVQMIVYRASVRDDGVRRSADVGVELQPAVGMLVSVYQGKLAPRNFDHG